MRQETIDLHIGVRMPPGYMGLMMLRSGVSRASRLTLRGGLIDGDFDSSILLTIRNESREPYFITEGDCLAQLVILPYYNHHVQGAKYCEYSCDRGDGSHGSTEERKRVHFTPPPPPSRSPQSEENELETPEQRLRAGLSALEMQFGSHLVN
jgi:dUTP pyrophosphatase